MGRVDRPVDTGVRRSALERLDDVDVVSLFYGADHVDLYARAGFTPTRQVVLHAASARDRRPLPKDQPFARATWSRPADR